MSSALTTDNYRKHTTKNPLQRFLINRFFSTLVREVDRLDPKSVLDVGCGEGFTLHRLRQANIGKDLVGVDPLDRAIKLGKKHYPNLDLRMGDAYKLPFKDDTFDVVLCCEVLEHLEHPERALKELVRVSKKYVVLSVPNEPIFMASNFLRGKNWSRWGNDIEHINHWSTRAFKKFVSSDLRVVKMKRPYPWTMVVGVK